MKVCALPALHNEEVLGCSYFSQSNKPLTKKLCYAAKD
jgi:hypothetical protein